MNPTEWRLSLLVINAAFNQGGIGIQLLTRIMAFTTPSL